MFRFFLTKKLFTADSQAVAPAVRGEINRRMHERYAFEHRHVTMMSDQDIMVVREVSKTGFSSVVSHRTWERMQVGDGYQSKLRLGSAVLDFTIKVAWKDCFIPDGSIGVKAGEEPDQPAYYLGFEIIDADDDVRSEWSRLIRPAALAASLRRVESSFMAEFGAEKIWYHGEDGCDLMIWLDSEGTHPMAWRLSFNAGYVEWRENFGFETGKSPDLTPGVYSSGYGYPGVNAPRVPVMNNGSTKTEESGKDTRRIRDALDILTASSVNEASFLIQLLEEELAHNAKAGRIKHG